MTKSKGGKPGGRKRRVFSAYILSRISANAPLPSSIFDPIDPVILNELVLSLRSTSEMKDLIEFIENNQKRIISL